jgi:hypothetical protein
MKSNEEIQGVSKIPLKWYPKYYCVANITKKKRHLKAYKVSIFQRLEFVNFKDVAIYLFLVYTLTHALSQIYILKKIHGLSRQANYTDRATACQRRQCQFCADRRCHMVSVTNPYGRILGFLDRSRYYCFQVAPQLHSRG